MSENLPNLYPSCCIPAVQVQSQRLHPRPILHLWGFPWNPSGRPSKGSSRLQYAGTWRDTSTSLEARRNFSIIKTQHKNSFTISSRCRFPIISVNSDLLIHVHLPREEFFEAVQFFAKVLFDHSKQRNFKILQLGLERGELSRLLHGGVTQHTWVQLL